MLYYLLIYIIKKLASLSWFYLNIFLQKTINRYEHVIVKNLSLCNFLCFFKFVVKEDRKKSYMLDIHVWYEYEGIWWGYVIHDRPLLAILFVIKTYYTILEWILYGDWLQDIYDFIYEATIDRLYWYNFAQFIRASVVGTGFLFRFLYGQLDWYFFFKYRVFFKKIWYAKIYSFLLFSLLKILLIKVFFTHRKRKPNIQNYDDEEDD